MEPHMCGIETTAGATGAGGISTQLTTPAQADGSIGTALAALSAALEQLTTLIGRLAHSGSASVDAATGARSTIQQGASAGSFGKAQGGGADAATGRFMLGFTKDGLEHMESVTGRKADIVRFFDGLSTGRSTLSTAEKAAVASGHTLFTSLKPTGTWKDVTAGKDDAAILRYLKSMRDEGGADVYFAFNHEADGKQNSHRGTGVDFAAAWRHIHDLAEQVGATKATGGNVHFVWTMTGWGFQPNQKDRVGAYYPGDRYVDVIGADTYNMGSKKGDSSFASQMQPVMDWIRRTGHDKPVLLPELGTITHAEDPGAQARWIADAVQQLKTNPEFGRVIGAMYWNSLGHETTNQKDFRLDDAALRAYGQMRSA